MTPNGMGAAPNAADRVGPDAGAFVREAVAKAEAEERGRQAQRERVVAAVLDAGATFWRDQRNEAHATIRHNGTTQRHRVGSSAFRQLARLLYGRANMARGGGGSGPRGSAPWASKPCARH